MLNRHHLLATVVDREFFETIDRYQYAPADYVTPATRLLPDDWRGTRHGIWYTCHPTGRSPLPPQGWKLHLSTTPSRSLPLLERVVPILVRARAPFKFLVDRRMLALSNSKTWPRGTSGKFITIYPTDLRHFRALTQDLGAATAGFRGPYILSDRRVPGSNVLFYRYGAFEPAARVGVTGERLHEYHDPSGQPVPDRREPYFVLPPWEADPFDVAPPATPNASLNNDRYRVTSALAFRNSGGVYLAEDSQTQTTVVIKEARPHVYPSPSHSSVDLLRKEFRLLSLLTDLHVAPEPIELFDDWEHSFLVQRHVIGPTLREHSARENPLIQVQATPPQLATYLRDTRRIFDALASSLERMHGHGVAMGDLSPNNVLVQTTATEVTLIDFEAAVQVGVDSTVNIATPSFAAPELLRGAPPTSATDRYAFGVTLLAFLCPMTGVVHLKPSMIDDLLRELAVDLGLPRDLSDLVRALTSQDPQSRPPWPDVRASLQRAADPRVSWAPAEIGRRWTSTAIERICDHIVSVADYERRDRLFPADPLVFGTNPLSLAYGACGTAYALLLATGSCPAELVRWIESQKCRPEEYPPGLYVGMAGIAWVLYELGLKDRAEELLKEAIAHPLAGEACDLHYGMAGTCLAALRFFCWTDDEYYLTVARDLAGRLAERRRGDDELAWWPNEDSVWFGMGRGASGIALPLLYLALLTGEETWSALGRRALQFEYANAVETPNGGWAWPATRGNGAIVYQYWDVGAAGVGAVTGRYFRATADPPLGRALERIVAEVDRKWAVLPGFATGLAGIGQFHLDMYDLFHDEQFLRMARRAASGLGLTAVEKDAGIAFPGDQLLRLSCDLATGSAGVVLFLSRLAGKANGILNLDWLLAGHGRPALTTRQPDGGESA